MRRPEGSCFDSAPLDSVGFWLRGVPLEMMREAAEEYDRRMQGALRDLLPYVNSLQAAMQKVLEAVEVNEEARGANAHLPPQVPKADDVKKLSDYSRSQSMLLPSPPRNDFGWLGTRGRLGFLGFFSVTYNSIGPAFLRGIPCCPASELSSAEYRVALRHILHAEQPLLGQVEECPDCGGERDPTGTHLLACRGGAGAGGGNWYSCIHHKLQRALFEVAKSAFRLASALHDDFAGYLTYSRNQCPDVTVLDAEGPGQHVLFDVGTARPMSDAQLGAAMMAPGAAAKKVEESKVDGNGDEDGDEEAAHGGVVGWKEKWIWLLSFALARGVAGLIIRRVVGRCPTGGGWRWAGGGRVRGGMGPDLDRGEAARRERVERLALMDRAWEDAFEETDYATQDGSGGGTQESEGTQRERSGQAPGEAGEAGAMASRLLESMEDVRRKVEHQSTVGGQGGGTTEARSGEARAGAGRPSQAASSVQDILNEWNDLSSPGPEGGV
ncbi:hypothetical protein CYMTET_26946 [Cymbomonas tetramitiformis]|uniref:Uncharacterized protein n=1 Tax=Cymbomonas tetramitiformis TaxID=36881 RepID=A0AAE0KXR0_9CHLO|nr:hypothetical protein CYMTET_26946 [Cymbomonas tetramitiformis]